MKIAKIKTSFATYTDAQVVLQAQNIVAGLTGNASFPTPEPTLETVSTAITAFTDALEAAREGSRTLITIKNTRRAELEALLRTLGAYVTLAANGDKAKLQSSLFPLAKDGEPTPPIAAPQNLEVTSGANSGEMLVRVKAVRGAKSYTHQYCPDPLTADSVWVSAMSSNREFTFTSLEPGKKYWFRVAAVGTRDQVMFSSSLASIVQ
jgi:hypothetical protein